MAADRRQAPPMPIPTRMAGILGSGWFAGWNDGYRWHMAARPQPPRTGTTTDPQATWTLPASPDAIAAARRHSGAWLLEMGASLDASERAVLVVSELFTNAVLASPPDGDVRLELAWIMAGCEIKVSDRGSHVAGLAAPAAAEPLGVGGRGLRVVAAVAGPVMFSRDAAGWTVVSTVVPR